MSREDEFIHNGFFRDPWQVALVLDPMQENWGCFRWKDGSLVRTNGFYVFEEKRASKRAKDTAKRLGEYRKRDAAAANAPSSSRMGRPSPRKRGIASWLPWAISALLLVGLIISLAMRPDKSPDPTKVAIGLIRISDYSDAENWLRRGLAVDPANSTTLKELDRLVRVRAALRAKSLDSSGLDVANLLLHTYSTSKVERKPASVSERLGVDKDASQAQASAESAHAAKLARAYWREARTWPDRIARALLASGVARTDANGLAGPNATKDYRAAVTWLQGEKKRFYTCLLDAPESTLKKIFGEMTRSEQLDLVAFAQTRSDSRPKELLGTLSPGEKRRLEKLGATVE
jgi:hypothetical protein